MMERGGLMRRIGGAFMSREVKRLKKATSPEPGKFMGFPVLLLTTVGARSGSEHTTVLGGFPEADGSWLVVASKGGSASHPHWFINLAKNPDRVWAQVGNQRFRAHVESLQGEERAKAYDRVVAVAKNYAGYLTKTDREIPVVRVTRAE